MNGAVIDSERITYSILVAFDSSHYVIVIGHDSTEVIPDDMISTPLLIGRDVVVKQVLCCGKDGSLSAFLSSQRNRSPVRAIAVRR
jgi:hypothetical protein